MIPNETQPENEPTGAHRSATDRAVAAVERMVDTSSMVGNAYADAYQQAVINMADLRGRLGDAAPGDPLKLVPLPANAGAGPLGKPLRDAAKTATRASEQLLAASRHLSAAYMDAYERAVLGVVDGREETAASTNGD